MQLGEVYNAEASQWGRPLDGVRVLALEQYIALPFATQILARLGAEVVKVEAPDVGEPARAGLPAVTDAAGRRAGASMLRYNLSKRSIGIDVKHPEGQRLVQSLAGHFDVVCENLGPGRAERFGLGYQALAAINPRLIYLSISGFGTSGESPYANRPAMAGVAEAMSGVYENARLPNQPPLAGPYGPLGDTGTALFGALGVLAAIQHRQRTGMGQFVDIAMFDSMLALCDFIPNYWSLGLRKDSEKETRSPGFIAPCKAADGWFTLYVLRRHQFERLARIIGCPHWLEDPSLATPWDWANRTDDVIAPAINSWAASRTKQEAARLLSQAGVPAAPCNSAADVVNDPHVAARRMIVSIPRTDGVTEPILVAGNPIKMSRVAEGPEASFPLLGADTDDILRETLCLDQSTIDSLRQAGVIR